MIVFRQAHKEDALKIAQLHAINWQQNYRGIFSNHFLDNEVVSDRLAVWKERCVNPPDNQHIILAEEGDVLLGFSCTYFNADILYGAYLDNLHVSAKAMGRGIGSKLMGRLANEIINRNGNEFYLWVLEKNMAAISFYDNLKGERVESVEASDIGDVKFVKTRYAWKNLKELQSLVNSKLNRYER